MSSLERLLRNGASPDEKLAIIARWAVAHDTLIEERWTNQHALNERERKAHCDLEITVNDLKIKVAVYTAVGTILGSIVGSVISATVVYALTHK